jgi:hypothetical protein
VALAVWEDALLSPWQETNQGPEMQQNGPRMLGTGRPEGKTRCCDRQWMRPHNSAGGGAISGVLDPPRPLSHHHLSPRGCPGKAAVLVITAGPQTAAAPYTVLCPLLRPSHRPMIRVAGPRSLGGTCCPGPQVPRSPVLRAPWARQDRPLTHGVVSGSPPTRGAPVVLPHLAPLAQGTVCGRRPRGAERWVGGTRTEPCAHI